MSCLLFRWLGAEQGLDGTALVHRAIALGGLVEWQGQVEDLPGVDGPVADQLDELGQEPAHRGGAAVEVDMGEEQLLAGQFDVVGDADIAHVPAGAGGPDGLHHRLLRADGFLTEWAPRPPVRSLMRATPSSPRSVTMSVAPKSRASFCRGSWRLIAMIRSAPSC